MTRMASARLAGFMYLLYIAIALPSMLMFEGAARGEGAAAKLAGIALHAPEVRTAIVLSVLTCFAAPVLAVGLYGITRDQDHELAVLALSCRVGEGVLGAVPTAAMVGVLWLATTSGATLPEPAAQILGAFLLRLRDWITVVSGTFFAAGSMIFCWLLLRGRSIPVLLAWLGLAASVGLIAALPLELAGFIRGAMGWSFWIPMLAFEITLGLWLLIKGVRAPVHQVVL